ncbi:MAG: helix-turn-helix domain-containing protein [Pseudomonadota bacterium]
MTSPRLLPVSRAAEYCGVSEETFRAHVPVAPVRMGRAVRYDVRAIDEWLDELRSGAPDASPEGDPDDPLAEIKRRVGAA